MSSKVLFSGKTHTTAGHDGVGRSSDGFLDIKLPQPHPAAEASKKKVTLPPGVAVDAQINLNMGDGGFFLTARLDVSLPGVEREVGEESIHAAHEICPYSKATHGNISVETNLVS